jgi:hypothetical protein
MINKRNKFASIYFWAILCLILAAPVPIYATTLVYPGDPNWTYDNRNSAGTAVISPANPRGYGAPWIQGNASLALTTSGSGNDWAFFTRYAGNSGNSWDGVSTYGYLGDINAVSFDWYRDAISISNPAYQDPYWGGPWQAQTPVLRILIKDGNIISELVWEKWYTDSSPAATDTWVSENLINQDFWRHLIIPEGYTIDNGTNITPYLHLQPLLDAPLSAWASNATTPPVSSGYYPYTNNAVVYGVSVGVGSAWLDSYSGYVDNIFLSFNNSPGPAINDNFELPVPEPATGLLLVSGLGIWAAIRRLKGRKSQDAVRE